MRVSDSLFNAILAFFFFSICSCRAVCFPRHIKLLCISGCGWGNGANVAEGICNENDGLCKEFAKQGYGCSYTTAIWNKKHPSDCAHDQFDIGAIEDAANALRDQAPNNAMMFVIGHSLGGQAALRAAAWVNAEGFILYDAVFRTTDVKNSGYLGIPCGIHIYENNGEAVGNLLHCAPSNLLGRCCLTDIFDVTQWILNPACDSRRNFCVSPLHLPNIRDIEMNQPNDSECSAVENCSILAPICSKICTPAIPKKCVPFTDICSPHIPKKCSPEVCTPAIKGRLTLSHGAIPFDPCSMRRTRDFILDRYAFLTGAPLPEGSFACSAPSNSRTKCHIIGEQCDSSDNRCPNSCLPSTGVAHCCKAENRLPSCKSCNSNGDCNQCASGYMRQGGKCVLPIGAVCNYNSNQCSHTCMPSTGTAHCCKPGIAFPGCKSCDSNGDCTACTANYILNEGKCDKLPIGAVCKYNKNQCPHTCMPSTGTAYCCKAGIAFPSCTSCNANGDCNKCRARYVLSDGKCVLPIGAVCQYNKNQCPHTCMPSTGTAHCCKTGIAFPPCTSCDSNGDCNKCVSGQILVNGSCRVPTIGQICDYNNNQCPYTCMPSTGTARCCKSGIVFPPCISCDSNGDCNQCVPGYTLSGGQCVKLAIGAVCNYNNNQCPYTCMPNTGTARCCKSGIVFPPCRSCDAAGNCNG